MCMKVWCQTRIRLVDTCASYRRLECGQRRNGKWSLNGSCNRIPWWNLHREDRAFRTRSLQIIQIAIKSHSLLHMLNKWRTYICKLVEKKTNWRPLDRYERIDRLIDNLHHICTSLGSRMLSNCWPNWKSRDRVQMEVHNRQTDRWVATKTKCHLIDRWALWNRPTCDPIGTNKWPCHWRSNRLKWPNRDQRAADPGSDRLNQFNRLFTELSSAK